ncbi:YaaA family protein [Microbacterium sp. P03]|uniref:YaaA family protein n=1 Tax=Microbacterium sp. P03 TaxID=3366946 RepID=UPI003744BB48
MLLLLPPSETKRPGGSARTLDLASLAFPELTLQREEVVRALVALSDDEEQAARVLRLGPGRRGEVRANSELVSAPTLPAIDRYTGVLYDALDAASLPPAARRWLGRHVVIHSAPFGPVGALDRIPSYRLGAGISLPGLRPLTRLWSAPVSAAIAVRRSSFVLDLRSEAYVALGPVPTGVRATYLRVVSAESDGRTRALNHFNKHAKGALVRRLAVDRPRVRTLDDLRTWADASGVVLRSRGDGVTELVV